MNNAISEIVINESDEDIDAPIPESASPSGWKVDGRWVIERCTADQLFFVGQFSARRLVRRT